MTASQQADADTASAEIEDLKQKLAASQQATADTAAEVAKLEASQAKRSVMPDACLSDAILSVLESKPKPTWIFICVDHNFLEFPDVSVQQLF